MIVPRSPAGVRVDEADALLLERLTGVELHVQGRCRARVHGDDGRSQAAGIVGHGLIGDADNRQEATVAAEIDGESARQQLVLVLALRAIAVELLIRQADEIIQAFRLAADLELRLVVTVAARRRA